MGTSLKLNKFFYLVLMGEEVFKATVGATKDINEKFIVELPCIVPSPKLRFSKGGGEMRLRFRKASISIFSHRLKGAVLDQQFGHPTKDDSSVTKDEFSNFVKELEKGFNDIAQDLENIERELGRKKNSP